MIRREKRRAYRAATDLAFMALMVGLAYAAIEQVVGYTYPEPLGYQLADEYSRADFTPPEWRE